VTDCEAMLAEFLNAFRREGERVALRTFPPKGGKGEALKIDVSLGELGDLAPLQDRLRDLNNRLGVYFVVNPGAESSIFDNLRQIIDLGARTLERAYSVKSHSAYLARKPSTPP
jgi:hypothetical protein